MPDIPSPLTWGTIRGNFGALNADSSDTGLAPDLDTVQGSVTLTPRIPLVKILNPANPMIAIAKTVVCSITNGVLLGPDGLPDVRVVATDSPGFEPSPLQWDVRIQITGATVQPAPMVIDVPAGKVVDLALIVPSPPAIPVVTVVTEETKIAAQAAAALSQSSAQASLGYSVDAKNSLDDALIARIDAIDAKNTAISARDSATLSSTAAQSAKTDAESARTVAQASSTTAQSAASSASLSASSAQSSATAADTARALAESAAESITVPTDTQVSSLVEDTQSNTRSSLDLLYVEEGELVVNVADHGAVADFNGTAGTDNLAAFNAALSATPAGGTLYVPPGRYYFSDTFAFNKSINFTCGSGGGLGPIIGTELVFRAGVTGVSISQGTQTDAPQKWRMGPFSIRSLSTAAGTDNGIFINAGRGYLDGATINSFGSHGLFVRAGTDFGGGNANNTYISQVRCYGNRGDGIRIEGTDTNACIIIKPDVVANYGWGINIQSSSMNKIIAPHADQQYFSSPGAYRDAGNSNDWDWVYTEGSSVFLMDTGSSNGRLSSSMYGAPTVQHTGSVHLSWDVRVQGGDWHQNFVNEAGNQKYRISAGGVALDSFDILNTTSSQRILSVDANVSRIQSFTNIRPSANNTLDLGSDSLRWKNVHVGGMIRIGAIWLRDASGVLQKSTDGSTWTAV